LEYVNHYGLIAHIVRNYPEILRLFIIAAAIIIGLMIVIVAGARGWLRSVRISKDGIGFETSNKETQKRYESGNLHKVMNDQIHKLDREMINFALDKSNDVRKHLARQLNTHVPCVSSRRALAAALRYPLYEASRWNNFKHVLRHNRTGHYIDQLMRELSSEYETYSVEIENNTCPVNLTRTCKNIPPLEDVFNGIRYQLVDHWANPIRNEQIETHRKKIKVYLEHAPIFEQLGDMVMVKVCRDCAAKNQDYIRELLRRGDEEIETSGYLVPVENKGNGDHI